MFNTLKKFVQGNSGNSGIDAKGGNALPSTSSSSSPKYCVEVNHNGIYQHPTSIHYDSVQRLCAVGFNCGTIKIFGESGMECSFRSPTNQSILKLIFLINTPDVIAITSCSIEKWDFNQQKMLTQLMFRNRITSIGFIYGCNFMYVGDESGNIQVYNPFSCFLSSYKITQDLLDFEETSIVYPTCIDICPENNNLLLIGYSNGIIVSWNLELRKVEKKFTQFKCFVTKVCWSRSGGKFICGLIDGQIYLVIYGKQQANLLYKPNTSNQGERISVDQLELVYTKDKKIILFKGYFQNQHSLVMIKGDNYKEVLHLGLTQITHPIISFVPVLSSPHPGVRDLSSILTLTMDGKINHFKLDSSLQSSPIDEINFKNWNQHHQQHQQQQQQQQEDNSPIIMEVFECDKSVKELIMESFQKSIIGDQLSTPITGGMVKDPNSFQLLITVHRDQTLRFWDFTDSRSYMLIGVVKSLPIGAESLSFCPETLVLSIVYPDRVLFYHLCNHSRRVQKTTYPTLNAIATLPSQQQNSMPNIPEQQIQQSNLSPQQPKAEPNQQQSPIDQSKNGGEQSTQQQSSTSPPQQSSPPEQNQQLNNNSNLPSQPEILVNPIPSGLQLISEFNLSNIKVVRMNPFKSSSCSRVVMGGADGKVYHFLLTLQSNGVSGSRAVFSLQIDFKGNSNPLYIENNICPISTLGLCFYTLRQGDDISLVHAGTENGYIIAIDLPSMNVITSFKVSSQPIQSIYYTDKKGVPLSYIFIDSQLDMLSSPSSLSSSSPPPLQDPNSSPPAVVDVDARVGIRLVDINIIIHTTKELFLYNVPSSNLSQYNSTQSTQTSPSQSITTYNYAKINKEEFKHLCAKSVIFRDIGSDQLYLSIFDRCGIFHCYSLLNGERKHSYTINGHQGSDVKCIQAAISSIGGIIAIFPNTYYTVMLQPNIFRNRYQYFIEGIQTPEAPKVQNTIVRFFFNKAPPKLNETFESDGVSIGKINSQSVKQQQIFAEDVFQQAISALNERGEKINELADKTNELQNASKSFASLASQLKKDQSSFW